MLLLCNKLNEVRKLICLTPTVGALSDDARLTSVCLTSVCLMSVCRASGYKSRTERPWKTKIGTGQE